MGLKARLETIALALVVALAVNLAPRVDAQDLTTRLSYFLNDLISGNLGATATFTKMNLGGTGATAVMLKYSNPNLQIRTGDDAGFTGVLLGSLGVGTTVPTAGLIALGTNTFAALGTPSNGIITYCSDCTIANPCAGAGTGALAKRLNGVWVCN